MTQSNVSDAGNTKEAKLPLRDWVLLPTLSLLTIVLIAVSAETIARQVFGASGTNISSCLVLNDRITGVRGIPNSVCREKLPEAPLVEYGFNCAGFRTSMPCGPAPPGTYRIVLIGSSLAMGQLVPIEKTLATLLPEGLSQLTGRKVELYNEGMAYAFPRNTLLRFNDVLAAKPDLILWVLTPIDVKRAGFLYAENPLKQQDHTSSSRPNNLIGSLKNSIRDIIREHGENPLMGSVTALRHLLYEYQSQSQYIQSYVTMRNGDEGFWDVAGAFRAELSPEWEARLGEFEGYAADIARMAKAAGVPLVAALVPNRPQAAMISMGEWPIGFDPYKLGRELRSIITSEGATYVDILPDFRTIPNAQRYYYPIDGHPDAEGHEIIAGFLAKELSRGTVPELRAAAQSQD
jgi:hypothetical protein